MRVTLEVVGQRLACSVPYHGAEHVEVSGRRCPSCGAEPWCVRSDERRDGHDTISGPAYCVACRAPAGELVVQVDTLFGLEEDGSVLMY